MQNLKIVLFLLVSIVLLSLSGCSSGSNGSASASDPFSGAPANTAQNNSATNEIIFGNISTANGKTGIILKTDRPSIDVNNGQVVVTANLVRNSVAVAGVPVSFSIKAPTNGPAAIETGLTTVTTDSNGVAITRVSAGNFLTTTNVIVQATATIGSQTANATTTFQLIRGNGVIMFTDKAGLPPGGQSNMLEPWSKEGVDPAVVPSVAILQLLPFKVTDSNGNPRVGVPITLSVYSITSLNPVDVTIDFLIPPVTEPNQRTITTDSAGMGIFNVAVILETPQAGSFTSSSVVFKATTTDPIPVTAYVGGSYSLTSKKPELAISPVTAAFGTATDITFTISGGSKPFKVTSNNTARVTATLLADGATVTAHLVDTTAWTGSVTISATDSAGQMIAATVTR
ncbi:MAG TPA: hypothetical protein VGJ93_10525 [Desulfuromonadaceae bacterium]|jgi:hypothetical protein